MKSFRNFNVEAWTNEIGKSSKETSVTSNNKYNSPTDFKPNSKKVGSIGPLEIHSSDNNQGGLTHFTWSPEDKKIHHVVHAVEKSETPDGATQLKYLSAHSREGSPVKMGQVYSHLVKNNNVQFVGTGHSLGAQKMWNRFHDDPDLQVVGQHSSGDTVNLNKGDKMYASKKATDPDEKRIGRMALVLRKKPESGN
jgi:hypothetical protein